MYEPELATSLYTTKVLATLIFHLLQWDGAVHLFALKLLLILLIELLFNKLRINILFISELLSLQIISS